MVAPINTLLTIPYYKIHQEKNVWQIVRTLNGHILCLCRNRAEAIRLTACLNHNTLT